MKRFTLRLVVALLTFIVGVAVATAWAIRRYQAPVKQQLSELQPMKSSPPSKVATNSEPPKVSLNELKMATKTVAEHEEGVYEIKASYPQIESLRTENVQRFN